MTSNIFFKKIVTGDVSDILNVYFSKLVFVVQLLYCIFNILFIQTQLKQDQKNLICVCEEKYFYKDQIRLYRDLIFFISFFHRDLKCVNILITGATITYFLQSILLFNT